MNKKPYIFGGIGLGLLLFSGILLTNLRVDAQECHIVRISGSAAAASNEIILDPPTVVIPKGGCVVWVNWVRASQIKVIFEEGKQCVDMTQAPVGFKLDTVKNCYVTDWIPLGGTSSLMFKDKGTYKYRVEATGGIKVKQTGQVEVTK